MPTPRKPRWRESVPGDVGHLDPAMTEVSDSLEFSDMGASRFPFGLKQQQQMWKKKKKKSPGPMT